MILSYETAYYKMLNNPLTLNLTIRRIQLYYAQVLIQASNNTIRLDTEFFGKTLDYSFSKVEVFILRERGERVQEATRVGQVGQQRDH